MPDSKKKNEAPPLNDGARVSIALLLQTVHMPPDTTPLPADQIDLLLELRRKERERRQAA